MLNAAARGTIQLVMVIVIQKMAACGTIQLVIIKFMLKHNSSWDDSIRDGYRDLHVLPLVGRFSL